MYNLYISIYAPTWGATNKLIDGEQSVEFQSTHPRGVRRFSQGQKMHNKNFNPRTRVGCDTRWIDWWSYRRNFNPRTRVGCDDQVGRIKNHQVISIHAPAWGATSGTPKPRLTSTFQSTHPRGVRPNCTIQSHTFSRFQSTHPRGVRQAAVPYQGHDLHISIHAPAWGATFADRHTYTSMIFQSTHPRGVRRPKCPLEALPGPISIHAPAWGATILGGGLSKSPQAISIHAPAWGATGEPEVIAEQVLISIHAPAWGATKYDKILV